MSEPTFCYSIRESFQDAPWTIAPPHSQIVLGHRGKPIAEQPTTLSVASTSRRSTGVKREVTLKLGIAVGVLGACIAAAAILRQNDLTLSERLMNLAARAPYRSVEARLTQFPHAQFRPAEEVRFDSRTLGALADRNINAQDAAIANLLLGRPSAAAALLRKAIERDDGQVEMWTAYSAALYEEGRTQRRIELFARSLAAAGHAAGRGGPARRGACPVGESGGGRGGGVASSRARLPRRTMHWSSMALRPRRCSIVHWRWKRSVLVPLHASHTNGTCWRMPIPHGLARRRNGCAR